MLNKHDLRDVAALGCCEIYSLGSVSLDPAGLMTFLAALKELESSQ